MKQVLFFLFFIFTLMSCDKNDVEYQNDYEKSYHSWLDFKEKTNNSYQYTSRNSSWIGTSTETTITVEKGQIIEQSFKYTQIGQTQIPENGWTKEIAIAALQSIGYPADEITTIFGQDIISKLQWSKNKTNLDLKGVDNHLMTLDQIYEKVRTEWLINRANARTYFEAKNNGLISSSGYTDENCQDDCFIGITISSIVANN